MADIKLLTNKQFTIINENIKKLFSFTPCFIEHK